MNKQEVIDRLKASLNGMDTDGEVEELIEDLEQELEDEK